MGDGLTTILGAGTALLQNALEQYGIWMYIAASAAKGLLILIIVPSETVTPTYVLLTADTVWEVGFIVLVGATAITLGNTLVYIIFRLLGNWLIGENQRKSRRWRLLDWLVTRYGKFGVFILRVVPFIGALATIPAAIAKMNMKDFLIYSFLGFLLYESLLGFGAFYGIKHGLLFQTTYGQDALFLLNSTLQ